MPDYDYFLLDANVFIEAKNTYYSFSICPGFWNALLGFQENPCIRTIDRIKAELLAGNDDLSDWVRTRIPATFCETTKDEDVVNSFKEIVNWTQTQNFFPEAKSKFAEGVDAWLIAYAKAKNMTLVTHEKYAPNVQNRIPIPNVCRAFSIQYMNTFEMLSRLQVSFHWQ